jgi:hypothetical protein
MFTKYTGSLPLNQTSIDDIPLDEQRAFFESKGWPWGEDFVPDERDDEMYAAWATKQAEFAETFDRIEVVYEVTAKFIITAGVYDGPMSNEGFAEHINSMGVDEGHIQSSSIIEVKLDDKAIAYG